jgi:hypothetical protein
MLTHIVSYRPCSARPPNVAVREGFVVLAAHHLVEAIPARRPVCGERDELRQEDAHAVFGCPVSVLLHVAELVAIFNIFPVGFFIFRRRPITVLWLAGGV